jgi:hypothetical protein
VPTKDGFTPDHPLPLFLSGHGDEHEERNSLLLLNASILVLVASLVAMAVLLSMGNPAKVFADVKASLTDISAVQPDTVQSTPVTQSTADDKALPPTATGEPVRDEIAITPDTNNQNTNNQSQAEIRAALLKQFQDWAVKEDARAQTETLRPAQDARAQVLQRAQPRVLPVKKH